MLSHTWTRIALTYAGLVLAMGALLALLLGGDFERREEGALRRELTDQSRAVAFSSATLFIAGAPITDTDSLADRMGSLFGTRVTIIALDGTVVGDSAGDPRLEENHSTRPEVVQALSNPRSEGTASRESATIGQRLLYVAVAVPDPDDPSRVVGVARVAYPMTSIEGARNTLWVSLGLTTLMLSLLAVALGVLVSRSIVGPLSYLRQTARRFGGGDLTARARIETKDEIGDLSRELNATADRLTAMIGERTEERNRMAAVLEHMHDGIILTDGVGRIESMNPSAARLFNISLEQASGRSLIEATHEHELHSALQNTLTRPVDWQSIEIEVGKNTVLAVVTKVPGPDGSAPTGLVVLQNVTELRRLERARRDFVANISHELRTPISSIKLLAETLGTAVDEDRAAAKDFIARIDVESDRLTQLVRELLELSRIESGKVQLNLRPVPVGELLKRAASRLRTQVERAGLQMVCEVDEGLPLASADAERIEQVLVNLLHNAIKFTNHAGKITLSGAAHTTGVIIGVADTGVGIPEEDLPRIFERFYKVDKARSGSRERDSGTGLGLAIAKHIVQAHGGQIWVTSVAGRGTTFYFTLPR
ncbi:MAG: ATP-binding protein, partial [Chloroflexia bacterium]